MLLRLKQPSRKKKVFRVKVRKKSLPPLYVPNPDSLLPHARCCRADCRAIVPVGFGKCLICGCMILSSEPLVKYTIYLEEF